MGMLQITKPYQELQDPLLFLSSIAHWFVVSSFALLCVCFSHGVSCLPTGTKAFKTIAHVLGPLKCKPQ